MSPLYPDLTAITEEYYDKVASVNLKGPFRLGARFGAHMAADDGGVIINVSTIGSLRPDARELVYGCAKAGLNALTIGLADAYGPKVRCNAILPGAIMTDIAEAWSAEVKSGGGADTARTGRTGRRLPRRRPVPRVRRLGVHHGHVAARRRRRLPAGRLMAVERVPYDEFGMFADNAAEYGIAYDGPPTVRRASVAMDDGRQLSALVWGSDAPELVLLHGGAQNAHTWDTVALALGRPLVAIDLPGHGHSDGGRHGRPRRGDQRDRRGRRRPRPGARRPGRGRDVARWADHPGPRREAPELVRAIVLVDITPGVNAEKAQAITAFVDGPASFDSFDDLLARTIQFNPTRSESSLRRGILHNALQREDGSWVWRYAALARRGRRRRVADRAGRAVGGRRRADRAGAAGPRHARPVGGRRRRRGRAAATVPDGGSRSTSTMPATACKATRRSSWRG